MTDHEKNEILNEHELSPDELKAVGGGTVIDWPARCEATVENGSSCWGTDACIVGPVTYRRDRSKYGCSSTVASTGWCSSSDYCSVNEIIYEFCDSNFAIASRGDRYP